MSKNQFTGTATHRKLFQFNKDQYYISVWSINKIHSTINKICPR